MGPRVSGLQGICRECEGRGRGNVFQIRRLGIKKGLLDRRSRLAVFMIAPIDSVFNLK